MRTITLLIIYYGCVAYALINPVIGLLFFIHITIFRPESLVWGNAAFGRLHFITALCVLIGYLIRAKSIESVINEKYQKINVLIFFVFTSWLIVVSYFAEHSSQASFEKAIEILKIFIICFLFSKLITTEWRIQAYIWVVSISFGALGFWGILQGLAGNPRLDSLSPGGSNYVAAQFALFAPLALFKAFDTTLSFKYKIVFLACFFSMIICCIYTNSRGGFIGMIVGLFVFFLQFKKRIRVLLVTMILVAFLSPLIPDYYYERIASVFVEKEQLDGSASSRFVLWKIAIRIWSDHPIAGVGLQNFSPIKETYVDKVSDIVPPSSDMFALIFNQPRFPHGLYPGMMAEAGLIGLLLYLTLLLRNVFCRLPRSFLDVESNYSFHQQARAAQAGLVGFAVAACFGDFQYIETFYLQLFFIGAIRGYADASIRGEARPLTTCASTP